MSSRARGTESGAPSWAGGSEYATWFGQEVLLGGLVGVLLWGLESLTGTVATISHWMGMDPHCLPVVKSFLLLVLLSMAAMFVILTPLLIIVGIFFAVLEYPKGARFDGTESARRHNFIPFCWKRAMEILRFVWAIALWVGNKVAIGTFFSLLLLLWVFWTPTLKFAAWQSCP